MKTESLTSSVAKVRKELQPHYKNNIDPMLFDYDFFTQLESFAKKEREKAKQRLIDYADKPGEIGTLIRTEAQIFTLSVSAAPRAFDKDLFINNVAEKLKVDKFKLKEIATASVASGEPRKSYKVEQL